MKRQVSRLMFKIHAANLLNRMLYSVPEEVDAMRTSILDTHFGKTHRCYLEKIIALKTPELQRLVRKAFTHMPGNGVPPGMKNFIETVVTPCLRVHVGSVDERIPSFAADFLASLKSRSTTDAEEINLSIAVAAASGKLEQNPFMQGLLVKCLRTLEREEKGLSTRGRHGHSELERNLISDAALTLSMSSKGSPGLAKSLGQRASPPKVYLDDLLGYSLPCPALALLDEKDLHTNLEIVDQRYYRASGEPARRLIVAVDHTYLQRSIQQIQLRGKRGLVGGCWWPSDPSMAFLDFDELPDDPLSCSKAPLMLEMLAWCPYQQRKECFSLASMPMSLKPKNSEQRNSGNFESWQMSVYVRMMGLIWFELV